MRNVEKKSFGWSEARRLYETSDISIRKLADKLDVNEKTVRLRVKLEGWERNSAPVPQPESLGEVASAVVERLQAVKPPAIREATEIAKDTRGTLDVARAELDVVIRNLHLIREIADIELEAISDNRARDARRRLIDKVLSLPGLIKGLNDLTSALQRLMDAGPGKKEERQNNADRSASVGRFAVPPAPKTLTH